MRRDVLELDTTFQQHWVPEVELQDVEAIRLLVSGGSPVDWQRLAFRTPADIDQFLRLHLIDVSDPDDRARLRYVFNEAVSYLEEHLGLHFPAEIRNPADPREVFLAASQWGGFRRTQILSCVILKLMHVIQHMEAADLKFKTAVSEQHLFELAHERVLQAFERMEADGLPVSTFHASKKSRSSVISKLIAKRENLAATVFDKLRYRIVVERADDFVPVLSYLTRQILPFNYVIPGQTWNNLLNPSALRAWVSDDEAQTVTGAPPAMTSSAKNEFSGATYRMINFIMDFPVKLPPEVRVPGFQMEFGRIVYVMVEFQLVDVETAAANEAGENAHALYKARQNAQVAARLKRGGLSRRRE